MPYEITIGTASGNKIPYDMVLGTASGNKAVAVGYVGTASGNKIIHSSLDFTISPPSFSDIGVNGTHTFADATANVTGGIGPFTYSWSLTGDVDGSFIILGSSTSAVVSIQVSGVLVGSIATSGANCTVTDTITGLFVTKQCPLAYERT